MADLRDVLYYLNNPGVESLLQAYELLDRVGIKPYTIPRQVARELERFSYPRNVLLIQGPFGYGKSALLAAIYHYLKPDGAFIGNASKLLRELRSGEDVVGKYDEAYVDEIERVITRYKHRGDVEEIAGELGDVIREYHETPGKRVALVVKEPEVRDIIRDAVGGVPKEINTITIDVFRYKTEITLFVLERDLNILRKLRYINDEIKKELAREGEAFVSKLRPRAVDLLLSTESAVKKLLADSNELTEGLYGYIKRRASGGYAIVDGNAFDREAREVFREGNRILMKVNVLDDEGNVIGYTEAEIASVVRILGTTSQISKELREGRLVVVFSQRFDIPEKDRLVMVPYRFSSFMLQTERIDDRFFNLGIQERIRSFVERLLNESAKRGRSFPAEDLNRLKEERISRIVDLALSVKDEIRKSHKRIRWDDVARELKMRSPEAAKEFIKANLYEINRRLKRYRIKVSARGQSFMSVIKIV